MTISFEGVSSKWKSSIQFPNYYPMAIYLGIGGLC